MMKNRLQTSEIQTRKSLTEVSNEFTIVQPRNSPYKRMTMIVNIIYGTPHFKFGVWKGMLAVVNTENLTLAIDTYNSIQEDATTKHSPGRVSIVPSDSNHISEEGGNGRTSDVSNILLEKGNNQEKISGKEQPPTDTIP